MSSRGMLLLLTTIVPGIGAIAISSFYLFPEWTALEPVVVRQMLRIYRNYEQLSEQLIGQLSRIKAGVRELSIAQSAERHRINCFAEGIGV